MIQTDYSNRGPDIREAEATTPQDLCGEPKYFPMEDEILGLSYELNLACGVPKQEGVERFRHSIWDRQGYPTCAPKREEAPPPEGFWRGLREFIQDIHPPRPLFFPGMIY